jgi:DNA invertase Pin-like site-specific DNA recombinase
MTADKARSAAIYVRISQDRGGAGLGVERQEQECRAVADRLGWTVVEVYSDNDISAFSGRRRPDYERMLDDIKAGRVTAVLAWHPDRLHRRSLELERYINVCESHGVENQTVTAGMWDLSSPSGRMVARQLGAVASYESEHKSERVKAAHVQQAKHGKHHGGQRPYGYAKDGVTIIGEEAAEIAAAARAVAGGASLRSIVRDMNERRVPTATGKVGGWTSQQLRQTLISPRIVGKVTHKGTIVCDDANWSGIVDDATWHTVVAILTNDARQTNKGATPRWLGTGLYVCTCGQRSMRASVTGGSKRYTYRCNNSHDKSATHVTRDAVALDAFVEKLIVARLSRPGTIDKLLHRDDTADVAALRVELAGINARKDKLASDWALGAMDDRMVQLASKTLDQRATEIAATLAKAGWRSPLEPLAGGDIEAAWEALSLAHKRAILDVVADVHVLPTTPTTRGFDPDGVRIDWKVS